MQIVSLDKGDSEKEFRKVAEDISLQTTVC